MSHAAWREVALVKAVIEHPACFDLNMFGDMLTIRTTGGPFNNEETIEVEWECKTDEGTKSFTREQSEEAARFFVAKRYELRLGIDFEAEDAALRR